MKNINRKKKVLYFFGFLMFLYLFLFSLVLIKYSLSEIGEDMIKVTKENISEVNAFGFGWLMALLMESGGAATSALIALNSAGVIGNVMLIYMVIGTRIGSTITALLVSLLVSAKKRDFRHGFEIGLANLIYAIPVAILMFSLEHYFSFFSKAGNYFVSSGVPFKLSIIDGITLPLINLIKFIPVYFLPVVGILFLFLSLKKMPWFILHLWGKENAKKTMHNHMKKKRFSFLIGFLAAVFLASTAITITLLISLIVARVINLKKVIPYLIGTNLGGVADTVIGGLAIGSVAIPALFTYVSFSAIGLLWLFNTELLFNITKFISKRTLHISKKRAVLFVLFFILLAFLMSFI